MNALLLALAATAAATDTPRDYSHLIPLTVNSKPGVVQLQLPPGVYLNAQSAQLHDMRVFDAAGVAQPFALRQPQTEAETSHRRLPTRIFPLMADPASASGLAGLEVRTATDGRVLSVRLPAAAAETARQRLAALVLDLRQDGMAEAPLVDALRFTLPAGRNTYASQVWLEASDDLRQWDMVGVADLGWLANASAESLANDRMEFSARPMRYARLRWRDGEPLQFAAIQAESPVRSTAAPPSDSLTLAPQPGRAAQDLVYRKPPGVTPSRAGLQIEGGNVVLPATLGAYHQLPKTGRYRFEPVVRTTFYRLEHGGQARASGDIGVPPYLGEQWVLRFDQPPAVKPALRISWQPATLVFVAGGQPPYTLAVGRAKAAPAARSLADVAPGFSAQELKALPRAAAGPVQMQREAVAAAAGAARAEQGAGARRAMLLWGVLLLGVGGVAFMVLRLLRAAPAPVAPDGPA